MNVFCGHPLMNGGIRFRGGSREMDVIVRAVPSPARHIDPAGQCELLPHAFPGGDSHRFLYGPVFESLRYSQVIVPRGERKGRGARAVELIGAGQRIRQCSGDFELGVDRSCRTRRGRQAQDGEGIPGDVALARFIQQLDPGGHGLFGGGIEDDESQLAVFFRRPLLIGVRACSQGKKKSESGRNPGQSWARLRVGFGGGKHSVHARIIASPASWPSRLSATDPRPALPLPDRWDAGTLRGDVPEVPSTRRDLAAGGLRADGMLVPL